MPASENNIIQFPTPDLHRQLEIPDPTRYEAHLHAIAPTGDARRQLLEALWLFMSGIVDFAYGQHPAQHPEVAADLDDINGAILRAVDEFSKKAA